MNKLTALFISVSLSAIGFCQSNQLSIESYRNFDFKTPSSFGFFDSEFLQLGVGSDHVGVKASFGLNYLRELENDWYVRFRPGFSVDNRSEEARQFYEKQMGYEKYESALELEKKSSSINLFVGAGKDIRLSDRFSLMVGIDLGFIADLKNDMNYVIDAEYQYEGSSYRSTFDLTFDREFVKYKRVGIMPIIAPVFHINESFSISAELQYFAAISFANTEEKYVYHDIQRDYNPTLVGEYKNEIDVTFDSKVSLFSISKISPLLRFSYKI